MREGLRDHYRGKPESGTHGQKPSASGEVTTSSASQGFVLTSRGFRLGCASSSGTGSPWPVDSATGLPPENPWKELRKSSVLPLPPDEVCGPRLSPVGEEASLCSQAWEF